MTIDQAATGPETDTLEFQRTAATVLQVRQQHIATSRHKHGNIPQRICIPNWPGGNNRFVGLGRGKRSRQERVGPVARGWLMVSGSADGQTMPEPTLKQMKRICKGDEVTTTMAGQTFFKAKIAIDPSKKPKTIDYRMTEGFTKGQKQLGIYEVDGGTFKSCFAKPGAERPADFTGKPGKGCTLSVWKREKQAAPVPEHK